MIAAQRSIGANGKENILFPLAHLNITQDSFGNYSHLGSWAIDSNKQSGVKEAMYAPFSGKVVIVGSPTYAQFALVSNDVVNHADGTVAKCAMLLVHSDNMPAGGTSFIQGDYMCDTGNSGASSGIHLHLEVNQTGATSQYQNDNGTWCLSGQVDPAKSCYLNDTTTGNKGNHTWKTYVEPEVEPEDDYMDLYLLMGFIGRTRK